MTPLSAFFDEEQKTGVRIRKGEGRSIAQHGELFQGQTEQKDGRSRCRLVSLRVRPSIPMRNFSREAPVRCACFRR